MPSTRRWSTKFFTIHLQSETIAKIPTTKLQIPNRWVSKARGMKQVVSVKDLEEMVRSGKDVRSLPEGALLTPSARDFLRDLEGASGYKSSTAKDGTTDKLEKPVTSKSPKA